MYSYQDHDVVISLNLLKDLQFFHYGNMRKFSRKIFKENFRFRSHFRWLNEIFAKEIERKFGNPNSCSFHVPDRISSIPGQAVQY